MALDTQQYLLPQRRNRVWAASMMSTGNVDATEFEAGFRRGLESLQSGFQFPHSVNFKDLPPQRPRSDHHKKLIQHAVDHYLSDDVFVDCSTTEQYKTSAQSVLPCLTPGHPLYSTALNRYLVQEDFMAAQGLWPSCFKEDVYKEILESKAIAQSICGNSFSSTVCQAVIMVTLALSESALSTLPSDRSGPSGEQQGKGVKRRLRFKQDAAEFDKNPHAKKQGGGPKRKRRPYQRKVHNVDSRKTTSKGKQEMVSIWHKEQVYPGTHSMCEVDCVLPVNLNLRAVVT